MKTVIYIAILQALLGAFDTLYYHEFQQQLPRSSLAKKELRLHAARDFAYAIIFISFGWFQLKGIFALILCGVILTEIVITIWDFIEEDNTRKLPGGERAMHTLMAIIYGILIATLFPIIKMWFEADHPEIVGVYYGALSWIMLFFAIAVFLSGIRDMIASSRFTKDL
jgi:cation transport ATPase